MFLAGSTVLSYLNPLSANQLSETPLSCISMNNQEYKVRPEIVNESRTNKTRHRKWHGTSKCKCRLDASFCNNKQRWNDDKCRCECKELIDKGICDKGYIWSPSNCECECDKSCDVGEYLDYKNCKCKKKLADKLVGKCTENIDEVKIANENEHENKCSSCLLYIALFSIHFASSCLLYIVLFSILFTINVGIGVYFVYYKYMNRNKENVSNYHYVSQTKNY